MKTIRLQSKRALRTALLILLLSAVGMTKTYAQSFTIGDLNYSVNDDGVSVTVTSHVDGQSATGTLTIPESVSYEGISYAVTTIGEWAFDGCQNLSGGLNIPNSVTTIGQGAFEACKGFSGVLAIPSFVTEIGDIAFSSCIGFSHLSIPDAVTTIGTQAFAYCCFEGELNISKNVKKIGEGAFTDCLFTAINVDSKNPHYKSQNGILFTHGMDTLMQYPKGKSETSYNIPNSVKRINSEAFYACFLTDVTIPNSVTSIGSCAFCGHWLLEDNVIDNIWMAGV
ncbi:MAG: leucine-rich repeat domain-containing protein [Bacteroidales bacterium]|nr:leucine-rich repeat domain-containing protein [Bacteroidales bacterium]